MAVTAFLRVEGGLKDWSGGRLRLSLAILKVRFRLGDEQSRWPPMRLPLWPTASTTPQSGSLDSSNFSPAAS